MIQKLNNNLHTKGVSYQAYYSEHGKAMHTGKDLTEVRSPQRKLIPDIVGLELYEQTSPRGIAFKAEKHHRSTKCGIRII